jgi:hypothetical protein
MMNNTSYHNLVNVTGGINQRWAKFQKEMCVNSFVSIFVSLVQKAANDFFKQIHFNDPECNTLMRGKEMLSKQEKQDLASSEALL